MGSNFDYVDMLLGAAFHHMYSYKPINVDMKTKWSVEMESSLDDKSEHSCWSETCPCHKHTDWAGSSNLRNYVLPDV